MTDEDSSPSGPDAGATPPPPPADPSAGFGPPAAGSGGGSTPADPGAAPADPGGMEPTAQMPATDAAAVAGAAGAAAATDAGAGTPPTPPPDSAFDELDDEEPTPWYKKPGPIAAIVIVVLLLLGLLAWLIFGGDDDDEGATDTSSSLVLQTTDEVGNAIDVGFIVKITGPADAPSSFVWLEPSDGEPGRDAGDSTGDDGRVEFEWEPDSTVEDPENWTSTLTAVANVPAGWTPPGPVVDCVLQPNEGQQSVVAMNVELDSPDATVDRTAGLSFPNFTFSAGDSVRCQLAAGAPAPTTVVETTVVETTMVETTEVTTTTVAPTTAPETTVPPTTVPPSTTTTSIDIPPPTPQQTLWDVIEASPSLTEFEQFVIQAGYQPALDDPSLTFTIFAPTNEAIDQFLNGPTEGTLPDPTTTVPYDLDVILLAHANNTEAIVLADLLNLPSVPVICGGPQPVTSNPATVGGAAIYTQVPPASNGVLYLIDNVLLPVEPVDPACTAP